MNPANDDIPTQAWIDLVADKALFDYSARVYPDLLWHLKSYYLPKCMPIQRENSVFNFCWFFSFEKGYAEAQHNERCKQIRAVS